MGMVNSALRAKARFGAALTGTTCRSRSIKGAQRARFSHRSAAAAATRFSHFCQRRRMTAHAPNTPITTRADLMRIFDARTFDARTFDAQTCDALRRTRHSPVAMADLQREFNSALEHFRAGRFREAELAARRLLRQLPDHLDVLTLAGLSALQCGRTTEAIADLSRAAQLSPRIAACHSNLGEAYRRAGRLDESIASLRTAMSLDPNFTDAWINLATVQLQLKQPSDALVSATHATRLAPNAGLAQFRLGQALKESNRTDEAIAALQTATRLLPDNAELFFELGDAYDRSKRHDLAVEAFTRSMQLKPDRAGVYYALGAALGRVGRLDDAMATFRAGTRVAPDDVGLASNVLFGLMFQENITAEQILAEHVAWAERFADPITAKALPHDNDRDPDRRLRVGYVSPDIREHPLAWIGLPLLQAHDRSNVEVYCYSDVEKPDAITPRFRAAADHWRDVLHRSDDEVAQMIRSDRIDVLIDLTMHMSRARPLLFARKPAPVQIAWFAYPGTTGLAAIDYRFTDPTLDPPGTEAGKYREESVRLPDTFWCYAPMSDERASELPAKSNGFVTFGCLNSPHKLNDRTIETWARIVASVDRSRFIVFIPPGPMREHVSELFAKQNVDRSRIEFVAFQPRAEYLRTHGRIDIALDTFPYNGHTTSLDAMWLGVPVVTLVGERVVGRGGLSQLTNLNLTELAAGDVEAFVRIATELANDLPRLSELRATLRRRMESSPLMDAPRFARGFESALRQCWRRWCAR